VNMTYNSSLRKNATSCFYTHLLSVYSLCVTERPNSACYSYEIMNCVADVQRQLPTSATAFETFCRSVNVVHADTLLMANTPCLKK